MRPSSGNKKTIAWIFISVALLLNPWSLSFLSYEGSFSKVTMFFIIFAELIVILLGLLLLLVKEEKKLFRSIIFVFVGIFTLTACIYGAEIYLNIIKWKYVKPNFAGYTAAYRPFKNMAIHPIYGSFFSEELLKTENDVLKMDPRGFRGVGPENAGKRKLAFFMGGSSAFGWYASCDDTTITGFLNKFQDEYLFVNAAVPSWISTQEFLGVVFSLTDYKPDLIIFFDGFNDAVVSFDYKKKKKNYPYGTYCFYEKIDKKINGSGLSDLTNIIEYKKIMRMLSFSTLRTYITSLSEKRVCYRPQAPGLNPLPFPPKTETARNKVSNLIPECRGAGDAYLKNLERIKLICAGNDIKTIFIFQPISILHKIMPEDKKFPNENISNNYVIKKNEFTGFLDNFRNYVLAEKFPIHDLSDVFDRWEAQGDIDTFFCDIVHLTDLGNKIIAQEILEIMKKEKAVAEK